MSQCAKGANKQEDKDLEDLRRSSKANGKAPGKSPMGS